MGFTFKKIDDESKFKNIVSYFDDIEQARDQKKLTKPNLKLDGIDKNDQHKTSWMHKMPGIFPGTPKSPKELSGTQVTLMVSPRNESSVKLPDNLTKINPTLDKKYTVIPNLLKSQVLETIKKTKESSVTGRVIQIGNYNKGAGIGFNRSSSNEPGTELRLKSGFKESICSPKKTKALKFDVNLSNRNTGTSNEIRKPDLQVHNHGISPKSQASNKKKTFSVLGLNFMTKK